MMRHVEQTAGSIAIRLYYRQLGTFEAQNALPRPASGQMSVWPTTRTFHFAHGGLPVAKGLGGGGKTAELPINV
jgi:hypothetical protein